MKRPSYREAILWIALNDEPECLDVPNVDGLISVLLVADLFDVESAKVAYDVVAMRNKLEATAR